MSKGWIPQVSYNKKCYASQPFFFSSQTATPCQHWQLKQLLPHPSYYAVLGIYFWLGLFSKPVHGMSAQTYVSIQWKDGRGEMRSNQGPQQTLHLNHGVQEVSLPLDCMQKEPREICFLGFPLATEVAVTSQLWKQQTTTRPQLWQ